MHGLPRFAVVALAVAALVGFPGSPRAADDVAKLLDFGTEMAVKGNWREARYRWERAAEIAPDDPRILNNLAVGAEALGHGDEASRLYGRAIAKAPGEPRIARNASRSSRFWQSQGDADKSDGEGVPTGGKKAKKGDAVELSVPLPLPPKLDVSAYHTVLVASFRANDTDLLDANREMVRFLRGEFRKHTSLQVLDVTPAPAVPEQTVEDMIANSEFWKWLGHEHGADLVVSGVMRYDRNDASGFEDVDVVDGYTGQKVKQTQFVEQERFEFEVEVFFFSGSTGALLHRDRFRRDAVYRGYSNDPITAFYDLSSTIAGDVLSVVSQRNRQDVRFLFKG